MDRWSVYIDIEGFSAMYATGTQALVSLGALMAGIYTIGSQCYPESPHRLFAHQLGDGFVVVGEFGWPNLEQACSVAVALLRNVLYSGGAAKGAISEGELADITGCYPQPIRDLQGQAHGGAFSIGGGLMTILPVMGTALINSYRLLHAPGAPSGSLLLLRNSDVRRLPEGVPVSEHRDFVVVDWVHASYEHLDRVLKQARLPCADAAAMARLLKHYIATNNVSHEWATNTQTFLNLK